MGAAAERDEERLLHSVEHHGENGAVTSAQDKSRQRRVGILQ